MLFERVCVPAFGLPCFSSPLALPYTTTCRTTLQQATSFGRAVIRHRTKLSKHLCSNWAQLVLARPFPVFLRQNPFHASPMNSMSASPRWRFDALFARGSLKRISRLRRILLTILASPLIDEVSPEVVHSCRDAMKLEPHDGAVLQRGHANGRDLLGELQVVLLALLHCVP